MLACWAAPPGWRRQGGRSESWRIGGRARTFAIAQLVRPAWPSPLLPAQDKRLHSSSRPSATAAMAIRAAFSGSNTQGAAWAPAAAPRCAPRPSVAAACSGRALAAPSSRQQLRWALRRATAARKQLVCRAEQVRTHRRRRCRRSRRRLSAVTHACRAFFACRAMAPPSPTAASAWCCWREAWASEWGCAGAAPLLPLLRRMGLHPVLLLRPAPPARLTHSLYPVGAAGGHP